MQKLAMHTPDITADNIAKLAMIFPHCVTEMMDETGRLVQGVDFDLLKQELSSVLIDGDAERYRLDWVGKKQAVLTANMPIYKTLRPVRAESVDFDSTENLFIEGDNLEALQLLTKSYQDRIKMIYIDPPYNTGNDFVYNDSFTESTDDYLASSEQVDDVGNRLIANTESNGRFHSDWLSMMYARLKLARNLLTDDGVIFISIGVEEVANLKNVCDEIFGANNFIEIFSWVKTSTPPALSKKSRKTNEYILCYEKTKNSLDYNGELLDGGDQPLLNTGNSIQELVFPKETFRFSFLKDGELKAGIYDRVELLNDVKISNYQATENIRIKAEFKWTQKFLNDEIKNGTTFIAKTNKLSVRFIRSTEGYKRPTNFIREQYTSPLINKKQNDVGTNDNASSETKELMGRDVFSYPKPVSLIEHLIGFVIKDGDIVLDFFAGSGTTAEAVMSYSCKNKIKLKYILVQLPELMEVQLQKINDAKAKAILKNGIDLLNELEKPLILSRLTMERIRRAGAKIKADFAEREGIDGLDTGFRVLKIDSSNMKEVYYRPSEITQDDLLEQADHIKMDRGDEDLLFGLMVDLGLPLSLPVSVLSLGGSTVYQVGGNRLMACFSGLNMAVIDAVAAYAPLKFVSCERAINYDQDKTNFTERMKQLSAETEVAFI